MALLLLTLQAGTAHAQRWYNVEVIIFAYSSDSGVQEEYWPLEAGSPDITNSVSLVSRQDLTDRLPGQITEFETLPFKMLSGAVRRMQNSSRYNVIYAQAWRLPDLPRHAAPPVRIRAGKRYTTDGNPAAVPVAMTESALFSDATTDEVMYEIDGRIKISLSKYLDVDADLLYRRHVTLPDEQGQLVNEFRQFRLTEFRRMKSKTIHYLDHPLFGVVIAIDRHAPKQSFEEVTPRSISEINQ